MNPENQQNQISPNFDWMDWIFNPEKKSDLVKYWERGKISYPENPQLEVLLKMEEYHLEAFLQDFRLMGFIFSDWIKHENKGKEIEKNLLFEELQALKYLFENKDIEIKIKSLKKKEGISIKNTVLIDVINESLLNFFMKEDKYYKFDKYFNKINPSYPNLDIDSWGKYLDFRFSKEKEKAFRKGRKIESIALYKIVYLLQKYLQVFTELKAEEGAGYSNKQGRFIFSFLEIHGLIDNLIEKKVSRKEDIILHYLDSYRELNKIK
jgi:hypothetical protein